MSTNKKSLVEIEEGVKKVFTLEGIEVDKSRKTNSVRYRTCIIYIARKDNHTYQAIGKYLGKGHDTCIFHYNNCLGALDLNTCPELNELLLKSIDEC